MNVTPYLIELRKMEANLEVTKKWSGISRDSPNFHAILSIRKDDLITKNRQSANML